MITCLPTLPFMLTKWPPFKLLDITSEASILLKCLFEFVCFAKNGNVGQSAYKIYWYCILWYAYMVFMCVTFFQLGSDSVVRTPWWRQLERFNGRLHGRRSRCLVDRV